MDKQNFSLSLFFPAYNEEANISETILKATRVAQSLSQAYEIIIVNDGSKDNTGTMAEQMAKQDSHIRVIHHSPNLGYGAALWSGIQAAKYDYIFFSDADLQFNLAELSKLVEHIPEYGAVLGYRAERKDPYMRLINAKCWNMLNRALFGLQVKDIDCAFKLFKTTLLKPLPIYSRGAMMSAEMLIHLQRQGVVFKEVPVTHLPRVAGSPTGAKPSVIFRALREMLSAYNRGLTTKPKSV